MDNDLLIHLFDGRKHRPWRASFWEHLPGRTRRASFWEHLPGGRTKTFFISLNTTENRGTPAGAEPYRKSGLPSFPLIH